MNEPLIVISEPAGFPEDSLRLLEKAGRVVLCESSRDALLRTIPEAEVLWIRLAYRIDRTILDAAPKLKTIVTPTTGLNHIDLEEAQKRGIQVISLRGKTDFLKDIRATAELTIGLMLSLIRHIPAAVTDTTAGNWRRDWFQGTELYGKTIGLFGYGRLGKIVAKYLQAFDARILVTDPVLPEKLPAGTEMAEPRKILREADIISLHVDLREDTWGFFNADMFRTMRPGACFINTSRGELIDEAALLSGLKNGSVAGAAIDVLSNENSKGMAGHALVEYARTHSNLIITPHIGGCTVESMQKTEQFLAKELHELLLNEAVASSCTA